MQPKIRPHALLVTIEAPNLTKKAQPTLNTTTIQVHANQQADQSVAHAPAPARLMGFCLLYRAMNRLRCAGKQTRALLRSSPAKRSLHLLAMAPGHQNNVPTASKRQSVQHRNQNTYILASSSGAKEIQGNKHALDRRWR